VFYCIRAAELICFVTVLQNALRAVVEFHRESAELPKIKILICKGREDVIIKVCTVVVSLLLSYIIPSLAVGFTCIVS